MIKRNSVILGECLSTMQYIADGSVDMILADLPYGTTRNKWDIIIPFKPLWEHYWRVLKPNGAIVLFAAQPFTTFLISSQIKYYKYELVWVKNLKTGNLNARKMPMGGHETIQIFYKCPPTYNPQKRKRTTEIKSGNKFNSKTTNYGSQNDVYLDRQSDMINPDTALLNFKCVHNSAGKIHPTQKPVDLCSYLVRTYTNAGDLVLDNTAGSMTTALACIDTERDFICIEDAKQHYIDGKQRIINHAPDLEVNFLKLRTT